MKYKATLEKLGMIGIVALMTSPLYAPAIYTSLNSEQSRVKTSRGVATIIDWKNGRGREVVTGGIPSCTSYMDTNYDGKLDFKTHMYGTPRRGVFIDHPQVTLEDQNFFTESIVATKNPEKRASWTEVSLGH